MKRKTFKRLTRRNLGMKEVIIESKFYSNNLQHQNLRPGVYTVVHMMLKCASSVFLYFGDELKLNLKLMLLAPVVKPYPISPM